MIRSHSSSEISKKGVPELSLGNVVGANIMNITLITGVAGVMHPLTMTRRTQLYNFPAMPIIFGLLLALARTGKKLTRREEEVLALLADDLTQKQIAERLHVSYTTVRTHVQRILSKLGVHSIQAAVACHLLRHRSETG